MQLEFFPVRASAELVRFGERIDVGLSRKIAALARQLADPGIIEIIPSYTTLLIEYDPCRLARASLIAMVEDVWRAVDVEHSVTGQRPPVEIPVAYGGAHGPDLPLVARHAGLTPDEVIRRHSESEYTVGAVGFSPGFGYLIGLDDEIVTPRLKVPRLRVPEGSVAIGGAQTAVYPVETAGGWNLIGRTGLPLFDPAREDPFLLRTGDTVRFRPVERYEAVPRKPLVQAPRRVGGIEVVSPGLLSTVQDQGRRGLGAFGMSPNGAVDAGAARLANRLVGNDNADALLEITLLGPTLRFREAATIAITGEGPSPRLNDRPIERYRAIRVHLGDVLDFDPIDPTAGARGYLAVTGGFDVPLVMDSRSTDLTARVGGFHGRALRAGDVLPIADAHGRVRTVAPAPRMRDRHLIRVRPGPQREMFDDATWRRFTQREFTVTNEANRVGIRLSGPALQPRDRADIVSEGVVTGSIQVPGSGQPIVLLPARATIGGYPKIATVIDDDLDLLGQLRPGDAIRFRETW
jgi:KipI family sensor histidine kinase inhibitor